MPQGAQDSYPALLAGNERYHIAFWHLHRRRPQGFDGPPPISIEAIDICAARMGFDFEVLLERVAACDDSVVEHHVAKRKGGAGNAGESGPPSV